MYTYKKYLFSAPWLSIVSLLMKDRTIFIWNFCFWSEAIVCFNKFYSEGFIIFIIFKALDKFAVPDG